MSKDFNSHQPAPQKRNNDFDKIEAGTPKPAYSDDAPKVGLPETGAGPGVPGSKRKIH